jgi:hypothetical protein
MPVFKDPIVISSIITVGGMLVTFFLTLFLQMKVQAKERFFYEVFPKRLAVYEDVIKELNSMISPDELTVNINMVINPDKLFVNMSTADMIRRHQEYTHTLTLLISRISIYGSLISERILQRLFLRMRQRPFDVFHFEDVSARQEIWGTFRSLIRSTLTEFTESIREETGTYLVDEKLVEYIGKASGKPKTYKGISHKKDHPKNGIADQ